ncbi:hypothetical protein [Sulfuracidifex tepidarius]|uniref:Uncharacterized protein n=1 Tax=Sulfuracidifex tepidarius TaxID=1294262 RepID=A0A510E553_9CREN|nr:hypothetical protein [Sulfuracidifex tepidarius]BBG24878.1 hypothetical protein IC006_2212 [Sulfuracidifex tepidarius]BBG27663.1 hypothetical protein IC007_2217 [Sulfuracidifex tepidarius]
MEYKYYPVTFIMATGIIDSLMLILGIRDFRLLILLNAIIAVLVEIAFFPFPQKSRPIINGITLLWIGLVVYYMIGILGGI